MARIMRSSFLNLLLLVVLFTNLLHCFDAQPVPTPAPSPNSPSPAPNLRPPSPTPAPVPPPNSPPPAPVPSPISSPPPNPNAPEPEPTAAGQGGSSGLSGGQKAGIVIGTLLGAAILGFIGMVCWKRRVNIRRNRYSDAARNIEL
ncbi:vegetative cell wall protein gp1 [Medicago truncatula]|nr:vegetative cell wall protein gp1 [Medicago truncatula]AES70196.1 transmembrane protein, putative [Medicago truncatula]